MKQVFGSLSSVRGDIRLVQYQRHTRARSELSSYLSISGFPFLSTSHTLRGFRDESEEPLQALDISSLLLPPLISPPIFVAVSSVNRSL